MSCAEFEKSRTLIALWTSLWTPRLSRPQASGLKRPSVDWKRPESRLMFLCRKINKFALILQTRFNVLPLVVGVVEELLDADRLVNGVSVLTELLHLGVVVLGAVAEILKHKAD